MVFFWLNHFAVFSTTDYITFPEKNGRFVYLKKGPVLPTGIEPYTYSQVKSFAPISGRSKKKKFVTKVLVANDAR